MEGLDVDIMEELYAGFANVYSKASDRCSWGFIMYSFCC